MHLQYTEPYNALNSQIYNTFNSHIVLTFLFYNAMYYSEVKIVCSDFVE